MLNAIIRFALSRRAFILLLAVLLTIAGLYTARTMEVDVFPDLNAPTVTVMTEAEGMAAEEVERLVTFPVETSVNGATNVRRVRSSSSTGFSIVYVEFDWGTDIYRARQIVSEKLAMIGDQLPSGAGQPTLGPQSSILGELLIIGLSSETTSVTDLRTIADWTIRPRLLSTGGVAQVAVIGGEVKEYQILLDTRRMKYRGVTMDEALDAVRDMNRNASGGTLYQHGNEYIVRGVIATSDIEQMRSALVKVGDGGKPVFLGDIAKVQTGPKTPKLGTASDHGRPAVLLTVTKQPDVSTLRLTEQIEAALEEMREGMAELNEGYARLYGFATGSTNANFTVTNYPATRAEAEARFRFEPEDGMDFSDVPASLRLNENRDGEWRTVVDVRDWTAWYFRWREIRLTNEIARLTAENAALSARLEASMAWGGRTANGVENPLDDTVVVDRANTWLMADCEWQKFVSGSNSCWVLRSRNAALSAGGNTNGFLEIRDAFGKAHVRINKTADAFADPVPSSIRWDRDEDAWYVAFSDTVKPTRGGANCELEGSGRKAVLYAEDDPDCPATITWPDVPESRAGNWIMKAVPKTVGGVKPNIMFFGAEIAVPGVEYVEFLSEAAFGGGIRVGNNVYEPRESGGTLTWEKRQ